VTLEGNATRTGPRPAIAAWRRSHSQRPELDGVVLKVPIAERKGMIAAAGSG